MYKITLTMFTSKGLLRKYDTHSCKGKEDIKTFIKEHCPDFYTTVWKQDIVKGNNGWVRIGMNEKGERILVNVFESNQ